MPDWKITITTDSNGKPVAFVPAQPNGKPGGTLIAEAGDIVTWDNQSDEACWPWPTDSSGNPLPDSNVSTEFGNYLSNKIAGGDPSTPYFNPVDPLVTDPTTTPRKTVAAPYTLTYCCKLHPTIKGAILVNPIPPLTVPTPPQTS